MREQLKNQISRKGLHVWRVYGVLQTICVFFLGIGFGVMIYIFEWSSYLYIMSVVLTILYGYLFIYFFPKVKWLRWRYEVRESEIELQRGIFIVKRTLIPMVRVQHVDTSQGPILRQYNLAGITISSAATIHTIPALDIEEANELRSRISVLARVAEDDV